MIVFPGRRSVELKAATASGQDRPSYGVVWAKFLDGDLVADGRCPVADRFDNTSSLRELPAEKVGDFHGCYEMTSLG